MKKLIVKQGIRITGGLAMLCLGGRLIYNAGCQTGVTASEWLVKQHEPEAYERLCEIVTNYKWKES